MSEDVARSNPYPGLRPFEAEEAHLFFGRDEQSDELLRRLRLNRFLTVVGTSGSGKSSLVRAGLLPSLYGGFMAQAGSAWRIAKLRPGNDPVGNLAKALNESEIGASDGSEGGVPASLFTEATLRRGPLGLIEAVGHGGLAPHENMLVLVDQFEEIFRFAKTAGDDSADDSVAFVKLLLEATQQEDVPIYVILTMRSEFLGDCARFRGLPEAINDGQYLIPRFTRDQLNKAIAGPAAVEGAVVTPRLMQRLLGEVGDDPDQLPILQHALMRTFDAWASQDRDRRLLDLGHYRESGGMAQALSSHADEAWGELADEKSRRIAKKLFQRLTEKGEDRRKVRRPTRLDEICQVAGASEEEVKQVVEVFRRSGRSFLMPPAGVDLTAESTLDISHESLMRVWTRLKDWIEEESVAASRFRRLAQSATFHRQGDTGMMSEPELSITLKWREEQRPTSAWAERYPGNFESAMSFLEESRAHREKKEKEEATRRWRKWAAAVAVPIIIIITIVSIGAAWYVDQFRTETAAQTRLVQDARATSTALVTWSSNEKLSRISPNRRLLSFVSDRDGLNRLYVRSLHQEESGAGTPFAIASPQEYILDTLWSPDSDRIALLLRGDDGPVLHIVPAFSGEAAQLSQVLGIHDDSPQLVRWIGSSLYLESSPEAGGSNTIRRFDIATRTWQDAAFTAPGFDSVRDFDLSADGQRVLFSASREGQIDLWSADFEGHPNFQQLTDDSYVDSKPRWFGAAGSSIVYQSNRSGQIDLWKRDLSGLATRLTSGPGEILLEDVAEDGSLLTFQIIEEKADLWSLNPSSREMIPVTADSLNDFWPSLSRNSKLLAFQRGRSSIQSSQNFIGNQVFDAKILLAPSDGSTFHSPSTLIDQGFAARLSPNAQWIAYLRNPPPPRDGQDPSRSAARWRFCRPLWVQGLEIQQGQNRPLNDCYQLPGLIPFPLNWVANNMVWSSDGHDLFFVSLSTEGHFRIQQCRPGSPQPCHPVAQASDTRQEMTDLHLTPDDRKLAYLSRRPGDAGKWGVRTLELESGVDRPLHSAQGRTLTLKGWTADGKSVLLLRSSPGGGPVPVEIVKIHLDGREETSGIVDNVYRYAGGLDPVAGNLYLIQGENGVRNIVAFSLATHQLTQLTGNSRANVAYSGLEISEGGELFFSKHAKNRDIWMLQFPPPK